MRAISCCDSRATKKGWHIFRTKLARNIFGRGANLLTKNAPKISPNFSSLHFVGPKNPSKSPSDSRKVCLPRIKISPKSFCRSAGRKKIEIHWSNVHSVDRVLILSVRSIFTSGPNVRTCETFVLLFLLCYALCSGVLLPRPFVAENPFGKLPTV